MFKKILIANRGEIALRVLRAAHGLGISVVAVHSEIDAQAKFVKLADESVCIGPAEAAKSYLNIPAIIAAAEVTGAEAIHPGYGFLAENPVFAERVEHCGFRFIGPSAAIIRQMGNKVSAIHVMRALGVPCVPGSEGPLPEDLEECQRIAQAIGYPLMVKASAGGGGRGMRVVRNDEELIPALGTTRAEALAAFGNPEVYLEKFLDNPRHIEVQVLGDAYGRVAVLGERDCSIQRRHQKVVEEAPAVGIPEEARQNLLTLCQKACAGLGYEGAGTMEFLYQDGRFYFIEMNTRIQVEHPVTEMVAGVDIVEEQIRIAAGEPLSLSEEETRRHGHAIECRINAEHPRTFLPCPGKITHYHPPGGPGIRVDSHIYAGYVVPPHYDSLLGKIIAHGKTRHQAISRMREALNETVVEGIETNIPFLQALFENEDFIAGGVSIHFLEKVFLSKPAAEGTPAP